MSDETVTGFDLSSGEDRCMVSMEHSEWVVMKNHIAENKGLVKAMHDQRDKIESLKAENARLRNGEVLQAAARKQIGLEMHIERLQTELVTLRLAQPPTARATDPETSHEAAKDAVFNQTMNQLNVMLVLHKFGPLTDFELADHMGKQQNSIGKRRLECLRAGYVEAATYFVCGDKMKRPTKSGSKAQVWRLTPIGKEFIREWMEKHGG